MIEFLKTKEFWAAIVQVVGTLGAAWLAVRLGLQILQNTEIKRLRIAAAYDLMAYRFVLVREESSKEAKERFSVALNSLHILFGDNKSINDLTRRLKHPSTIGDKNDLLLSLLKKVAFESGIPLTSVKDADILDAFSLR